MIGCNAKPTFAKWHQNELKIISHSDFVIPDLQNGQNAPKMPPKCLYDFCFLKTCNT